jgi:RND superfamily putative drug exporter
VAPLLAALRADSQVAVAISQDNGRDLTLVVAVPTVTPDSPQTVELVHRIRGAIVPRAAPPGHQVLVGGVGATIADIVDECSNRLWWIIGIVLAMTFLLLVVVLRSVLLPLKAIAMNLLATAASFGLLVLMFQRGWAEQAFDFISPGYIWVHTPIVVFVLLFAASMDYELFLVRRIQESYRSTGDNTYAVAAGLQRTARSITMAAIIMAVVFASLIFSSLVGLKEFGFTLTVGIMIDATLIRLILVPALMQIMGRLNWWSPFPSRNISRSGNSAPEQVRSAITGHKESTRR